MSSNKVLKKIKYALRFIPDRAYIQIYYFAHFKRFCNLKHPKTYNEKLNYLKLKDRNPIYSKLVDKYEVKEYVAELIGKEYIIPTLGVWDFFEDIDFDKLPDSFVIKCTHDSEGVVIVKDKSKFDKEAAREKIQSALNQNFFYIGREWPYKNVRPRIIVEEYMEDMAEKELKDYKFFCFAGEPKAMFIASERITDRVKFDYFDLNFEHLNIRQKYPNTKKPLKKPQTFEEMIEISRILSKGFPQVRVDFYEINGKLFFGEMTFFHFSGFVPFEPKEWDRIFGDWIVLPCDRENGRK